MSIYQRKEQVRSLETPKNLRVVYDNTDKSPYYKDTGITYLSKYFQHY